MKSQRGQWLYVLWKEETWMGRNVCPSVCTFLLQSVTSAFEWQFAFFHWNYQIHWSCANQILTWNLKSVMAMAQNMSFTSDRRDWRFFPNLWHHWQLWSLRKWKRNMLAFKTFILGEVFRYRKNLKKTQKSTTNLCCSLTPVAFRWL